MTADADAVAVTPARAIAPVPDLTELEQITVAVTTLPALPLGTDTRYSTATLSPGADQARPAVVHVRPGIGERGGPLAGTRTLD